jgi:hypothetical protein
MADRIVEISNHTLDTFLAGRAVPNAMPCTITDWIQRCSRMSPIAGFRRQGRMAQCNKPFKVKSLGRGGEMNNYQFSATICPWAERTLYGRHEKTA